MNQEQYLNAIHTASDYIKSRIPAIPKLAIVLGSGLAPLADELTGQISIPYEGIPNFPVSTVPGHEGKLIYGTIDGNPVLAMKGRFHYYEGYDMQTVTFPIRVFAALGIRILFVTNAAGGIAKELSAGSIMLIRDHLTLFMPSPLRGGNLDEFGPRFKDMSGIYTERLKNIARHAADEAGITVTDGVYCFYPGPQFETPADICALKVLGADATGMSTVPEAVVARHSDMEVIGLSLITNKAAGLSDFALNHDEVLENGRRAAAKFSKLAKEIIKEIYVNDTQL